MGGDYETIQVQRRGNVHARAGDDMVGVLLVLEDRIVLRAEYDRRRIPGIGGNLSHAEVLQRALGAVVSHPAMPNVEQPAHRQLPEAEVGPERAGPIGVRIADDVGLIEIELGQPAWAEVERPRRCIAAIGKRTLENGLEQCGAFGIADLPGGVPLFPVQGPVQVAPIH